MIDKLIDILIGNKVLIYNNQTYSCYDLECINAFGHRALELYLRELSNTEYEPIIIHIQSVDNTDISQLIDLIIEKVDLKPFIESLDGVFLIYDKWEHSTLFHDLTESGLY